VDIGGFAEATAELLGALSVCTWTNIAPGGPANDISLGFVFGAGSDRERESEAAHAINIAPVSQFRQTWPGP